MQTPAYRAIERELAPRRAAADDEIVFEAALFRRIAAVHDHATGLTPEQRRLADRVYDRHVRRGARLDAGQKARTYQPMRSTAPSMTSARATST